MPRETATPHIYIPSGAARLCLASALKFPLPCVSLIQADPTHLGDGA